MVCSSVITSIHISLLMCYQVGGLSTIAPEGQKPTNDKTNWFFFFANHLSLSFQKWWARFPLCKILAAMVLFFWCCNIWIHWKTACYGMFLLMKWTSIFHQKYYLPIKGMVPIQCLSDLMTLMFHIGFVILRHLNKHNLAS